MVLRAHVPAGVLIVALALAAPGCTAPRAPSSVVLPNGVRGLPATVSHVTDGDTVDLRLTDGAVERARLLGIDTPETVKPNHPVECFGPEASARTKELLPPGTEVVLQRDEEARDRFGRLLVYVWRRSDGRFINGDLVDTGHADTLSISPNTAHRSDLAARRAAAQQAGVGQWASCPAGG